LVLLKIFRDDIGRLVARIEDVVARKKSLTEIV